MVRLIFMTVPSTLKPPFKPSQKRRLTYPSIFEEDHTLKRGIKIRTYSATTPTISLYLRFRVFPLLTFLANSLPSSLPPRPRRPLRPLLRQHFTQIHLPPSARDVDLADFLELGLFPELEDEKECDLFTVSTCLIRLRSFRDFTALKSTHDNRRTQVRFEPTLRPLTRRHIRVPHRCKPCPELRNQDQDIKAQPDITPDYPRLRLESQLVESVPIILPRRAEPDVAGIDRRPSDDGGEAGDGEHPVEGFGAGGCAAGADEA